MTMMVMVVMMQVIFSKINFSRRKDKKIINIVRYFLTRIFLNLKNISIFIYL